jgi:hypothetical protein
MSEPEAKRVGLTRLQRIALDAAIATHARAVQQAHADLDGVMAAVLEDAGFPRYRAARPVVDNGALVALDVIEEA